MKIFARILAPLTLLEWGGILSYFYFSGRLAAFLHPMFRPLVLATGILLLITGACVAFFRDEESEHEHEHEHVHEEEGGEDLHQHSHSHDRLSVGGFLAFATLILPLALASKISPDSYGANLIKNRGLVKDIRSLPSAASSFAKRMKPEQKPSLTVIPSPAPPKYIGVEETPGSKPNPNSEPALPSNDSEQATPPSPTDSSPSEFVNDFLKPDKAGRIKCEIVDLLYAAQEASTRKDFEGKQVELIGQLVPAKPKGATKSTAPAGSFKLLRLVMVCCAADAMPIAVKIETKLPPMEIRDMQWLKVTGRVQYRPRVKDDSDDTDYGDQPEPVIVADSIKKVAAPTEKYLY
jgi:uncharacterized repeat protein (TIGR03943 family)